MKFIAEVVLLLTNIFFLIANLSKMSFAANPSSLTYLGFFLNIAQIIYFSIPVYRFYRRNEVTIRTMRVDND